MTAVLIPTASEAEWLEARRQGITASEIAVIMGLSPWSSPYALYHQKLGTLPPAEDTTAMERGRVLESYIAEKFAAAHPEFWVWGDGRSLFAHPQRPWQMATPDRLVTDGSHDDLPPYWAAEDEYYDVLLETKTDAGSDEWGEPGSDEIPVHYRAQVLWQMDVMGVDCAYVACLRIRDWKVLEYELAMDMSAAGDLELMRHYARDFLDRIGHREEPDTDWRPATADALKRLHPSVEDRDIPVGRQLAISYRAALRRYKAAERRKDEMTNRMLAAIGSGRRAVDDRTGEPVAARQVYDQKEYVRKACTVNKLVPAKPKKEAKP